MVPMTVRAVALVVSIAVMTGMAVGYVLDQRVEYVTPRALDPEVERASIDMARLSQP